MEPPSTNRTRRQEARFNISRLLPFLFMGFFVLFILKEEVPALNRWYQSIVAPERYQATTNCQRAALNASSRPDYARVRSTGSVHETQNGFYVEGVEIGEMGENGTEVVYRFNCYTERGGALVNTHKESAAAAQQ